MNRKRARDYKQSVFLFSLVLFFKAFRGLNVQKSQPGSAFMSRLDIK